MELPAVPPQNDSTIDSLELLNRVEVDLDVIYHNTAGLVEQTGVPLMAVVKANAYGHGAVQSAGAIKKAGVAWFGVARLSEAMTLRQAGFSDPILVLNPTIIPAEVRLAIQNRLTLTLSSVEIARLYLREVKNAHLGELDVHLKVDTGMGRFGVFCEEAPDVVSLVKSGGGVRLGGIYSHFSIVDEIEDHPLTRLQLQRFEKTLITLEKAGSSFDWVHFSNSGSAVSLPGSYFNLVRCGSALYGLTATFFRPDPAFLKPALSWKARLLSCKKIPAGWNISYGEDYHVEKEEWTGVIPAGYADGFRRAAHNRVIVDGQLMPVLGRVCMDNCIIRLPRPLPVGCEVVIIGRQGDACLKAQDHGDEWGTIDADVTAQINQRVPRIYTGK